MGLFLGVLVSFRSYFSGPGLGARAAHEPVNPEPAPKPEVKGFWVWDYWSGLSRHAQSFVKVVEQVSWRFLRKAEPQG